MCLLLKVSKFRCSGACSIQTHMESLYFVVQGTHENKIRGLISEPTFPSIVPSCLVQKSWLYRTVASCLEVVRPYYVVITTTPTSAHSLVQVPHKMWYGHGHGRTCPIGCYRPVLGSKERSQRELILFVYLLCR